jgi:cysteine desulfuration protein SufE
MKMGWQALDDIVETFQSVDASTRVELLLDYARKLPPLPARYEAERDAGLHRVPECMTPVFLWVEADDGTVNIQVHVAEEAPTVQGLLSIIVHACRGATPGQIATLPSDLMYRLGLGEVLRMQRVVGLSAIIERIRRQTLAAVSTGEGEVE